MIRLPGAEDDDLLEGLKAIADFLGKNEEQVRRLIRRKQIPAFRLSGRWHLRKSRWHEHVRGLEDATLGDAA